MTRLTASQDGACSRAWDSSPAAGSAPRARGWLAIEQPGPWGSKALEQSRLDPEVGVALQELAREFGGKVLLIRKPGRHAVDDGPRRVYVANVVAGWVVQGDVDDAADLTRLDPSDVVADSPAPLLARDQGWERAQPVALVCAHSQRDVCCALRGRPVTLEAAALVPGRVWECSHLGGHRFAATGLILPTGQVFARLTSTRVAQALAEADADRVVVGDVRDVRGRSCLTPAAQVADVLVRQHLQLSALQGLSLTDDGTGHVSVQTPEGEVRVQLDKVDVDVGPVSCGKPAGPYHEYRGRILHR